MQSGLYLLQNSLEVFSPSERSVAEYILQNPQALLNTGITELAQQTGSSSAAVIRLCKRLKLDGFSELKMLVARDVYSQQYKEEYPDFTFSSQSDITDISRQLLHAYGHNVDDLNKTLNVKSLEAAADTLAAARSVFICGFGASGLAAMDLHQKLTRLGKLSLFEQDTHLLLTAACNVREQDAAIAFSYSGETKEVLASINMAKQNGAKTIAVTRIGANPLSKAADISLFVPGTEPLSRHGAILSRLNQLMIIDILYTSLITKNMDSCFANIEKTKNAVRSVLRMP